MNFQNVLLSVDGMPPKVSMPVVNQITRSPGLLNFNRFSPHTFHLDKKIEVFAAEGSPNHESPGQLKFPGSVLEIISSPLKTKLTPRHTTFHGSPSGSNAFTYQLCCWVKKRNAPAPSSVHNALWSSQIQQILFGTRLKAMKQSY